MSVTGHPPIPETTATAPGWPSLLRRLNLSHNVLSSLLWSILCALAAGCSANIGPPHLVLSSDTLDLGPASPGEERRGSVTLTNRGGAPLLITKVDAACACSSVRLTKDIVPPGDHAELSVAARPRAGDRHTPLLVRIMSNDPRLPEATLILRFADEVQAANAAPDRLSFGDVVVGSTPSLNITFSGRAGDTEAISVTSTAVANGLVEVKVVPSVRSGGGAVAVSVTARGDLPIGPFQDTITAFMSPGPHRVDVPVEGRVVPRIVASPPSLYFGDVTRGSTAAVVRRITVRRTDGKELRRLTKVDIPHGFTVEEESRSDRRPKVTSRHVRVSFDPRLVMQDAIEERVALWLDGESAPVVVPVRVFVKKSMAQTKAQDVVVAPSR